MRRREQGAAPARGNDAPDWTLSSWRGSRHAFARCIRAARPIGPSKSRRTRARSTSGRVGRSAAAKHFDEEAVRLAVVAHVRHDETHYDELLARGGERWDARDRVREDVDRVLSRWRTR